MTPEDRAKQIDLGHDLCCQRATGGICYEHQAIANAIREERQRNLSEGFTYCAYCGAEFPIDRDGQKVAEHIRTCEKHPMQEAIRAEREACARIADMHERYELGKPARDEYTGEAIAAVAHAIRARGKQ